MTAWTTISNALVAVGAKPFATTVQAFRDNALAALEADATAPVNQTAWHPYNKITNGDANTGVIYDFAVNGAVATITSPDWADGYEYRFRLNRLSRDGSLGGILQIELYRETAATYTAARDISPAVSISENLSGVVEIHQPRLSLVWHLITADTALSSAVGAITPTTSRWIQVENAQKLLRARFRWTVNNSDLGEIYMDRRRVIT